MSQIFFDILIALIDILPFLIGMRVIFDFIRVTIFKQ